MEFLYLNKRIAIWMPMGGGKSVSTLTALDNLSSVEDIYPILILAPLRVAKTTWPDEIEKWSHLKDLRVSVICGTAAERTAALNADADIYTVNYDNIVWMIKTLGRKRWPFKTIVADEFTRLKGYRLRQGAQRARALSAVAFKSERFVGLTGTPSPNGLIDLWGQTWFLDKGARLGHSYGAFEDRWFKKGYNGYGVEPLPHAQKEIEGLLRDICLTVAGLPVDEPIKNIISVIMPPDARSAYDEMEGDMYTELEDETAVEVFTAASRSMKLLQFASGAVYIDDKQNWTETHRAKIEALESVIEEANGAPVLVAYHFKSDLARLQKAFPKARVLDANPKTIKDWNAGKISILFAHPACLHPDTEVLTENRGWVKMTSVRPDERVYDGVEFVTHKGCHFSGVKPVMNVFGVTMTENHKLLINGKWVEAKDVRNTGNAKREARYEYAGNDPYLSQMLSLQSRKDDAFTERNSSQQGRQRILPVLHRRHLPSDDQHTVLFDMERDGGSSNEPEEQRLEALRGCGARGRSGVGGFQELLRRHVYGVFRRADVGSQGQFEGLQQSQLPLGFEHVPAIEQEQQPGYSVLGSRHAPSRILSCGQSREGGNISALGRGNECGRSATGLREKPIQKEPKASVSKVYDLVDCGPRHRFLIRNTDGEVFVSHNSAGHGLNLARGGNILVFFTSNWNLEEHMQIIERIGPMRQKQAGLNRPVFIHYLVAKRTVDELVLDRLHNKRRVQDVILEAMKRRKG
jgi:hypothetical protein